MNPTDCQSLHAFLRRIRRRLWWQDLFRRMSSGIEAAGWLLAGAGLIHVFFMAVPRPVVLALAVSPLSIGLAVSLLRPGLPLATCAMLADRWFGGHCLLTSAWDLLINPPAIPPAGATHILSQARQLSARWGRQLHIRQPWRLHRRSILATVIGLSGLFLLQSPAPRPAAVPPPALMGSSQPQPLAERLDLQPRLGNAEGSPRPPAHPSGPPSTLPSRPMNGPAAASLTATSGGRPTAAETADLSAKISRDAPLNDQNTTGAAPTAGTGAGGDSPGAGSNANFPANAAAAAEMTLQPVDIPLPGTGQQQAAADLSTELETVMAIRPDLTAGAAAPAELPALPYQGDFSLVVRAYIAAYFGMLRETQ